MTECPFDHRHTMTIGSTCDNEQHKLKFGKLQVYKVYNRFVDLFDTELNQTWQYMTKG